MHQHLNNQNEVNISLNIKKCQSYCRVLIITQLIGKKLTIKTI